MGLPLAVPADQPKWALVSYLADAPNGLLHERMLLHRLSQTSWIVATPDGDVYPLAMSSPPLDVIIALPDGVNGGVTGLTLANLGLPEDECYLFRDMHGAGRGTRPNLHQVHQLMDQAVALSPIIGVPPAAGGLGVAAPMVAAGFWVLHSPATGFKIGDAAPSVPVVIEGRFGLIDHNGETLIVERLGAMDANYAATLRSLYMDEAGDEEQDVRLLRVKTDQNGLQVRDGMRVHDVGDAFAALRSRGSSDFDVDAHHPEAARPDTGPASRALASLVWRELDRSQRLRARDLVERPGAGMLSRSAECLQLGLLGAGESSPDFDRGGPLFGWRCPELRECRAMMGLGSSKGSAMVAPAMRSYVAKTLQEKTSIMKEKQKAGEEKRLLGGPKK